MRSNIKCRSVGEKYYLLELKGRDTFLIYWSEGERKILQEFRVIKEEEKNTLPKIYK